MQQNTPEENEFTFVMFLVLVAAIIAIYRELKNMHDKRSGK